jgi:metallophosphoesterase (TIGR03767 family)
MSTITRRRFMALVAGVAAATGLPRPAVARALLGGSAAAQQAAELTTLGETLGPGAPGSLGFRPVVTGGGEPHVVREELGTADGGRAATRESLLVFAHLTDQHIIDVQSTTRVEFLDRYADGECEAIPFSSAHRPGEAACARVADAMLRRLRAIGRSPVTGAPLAAAICTGDNTDNQQENELDVFLAVMDGGPVTPQSGNPDVYEGVQASGDIAYWHPDPTVADGYKTGFGFPDAPGYLDDALAPFEAVGAGVPWYTCYGNHDGLIQGNVPIFPGLQELAAGPFKPYGLPPGTNPCDPLLHIGELPSFPAEPVTPDPGRRAITRGEWIAGHLESPGLPAGHGFGPDNLDAEHAYYAADVGPLRWLVLDTVNPGGFASGSIGDAQLAWLEAELTRADAEQRLVMLFSHHGLRSLDNPFPNPDPFREPGFSDLPRHLADTVEAVVAAHPCVIAWVNGHTHRNTVEPRAGFWDIGTAAHVDWPPQSRIIEVVDNHDGTLSIFATMVDYEGGTPVLDLTRTLIANDPQGGFGKGDGEAQDRNVELLLAHPFAPEAEGPRPASPATTDLPPVPVPQPGPPPAALPATGIPPNLTVGGALLLAGAVGVRELRRRAEQVRPPGQPPG